MAAKEKFTQELSIPCYMTDISRKLRPLAFMDLSQAVATLAADELEFGDIQMLEKHGAVWVLARMKVEFLRMPEHREKVTLSTWHKGLDSLFFVRDYQMSDAAGNAIINATSSWVVMNVEERRVLRSEALSDIIPGNPQCADNAIEKPAGKVVIPKTLATRKVGSHRVSYSDVDYNRHANNAKYTVWAMDCLPEELVYNRPLKKICLNFNREALPGEVIDLFCSCDGETFYVEGRCNDLQVFVCSLKF